MNAEAATEIHERELVKWLFTECACADVVWQELQIPTNSIPYFCVETSQIVPTAKHPGDIDCLTINMEHPEASIAIEAKRVKVKPDTFATGMPTKLGELCCAVKQANSLREVGFSRVILLVILIVDGRKLESLNFFHRRATPDLFQTVSNNAALDGLSPEVGMTIIELTQPTDKSITDSGGIGFSIVKPAPFVPQSGELTSRIQSFVSKHT